MPQRTAAASWLSPSSIRRLRTRSPNAAVVRLTAALAGSDTMPNPIRPNRKRPECIAPMRVVLMRGRPCSTVPATRYVLRRPRGERRGGGPVFERSAPDSLKRSLREPDGAAEIGFLDIPDDAGRYRDALTLILLRIPEGWNQSITCGAGWYPLIAKLHLRLCEVDVDHNVYEVTEKSGTLQYIAYPSTQDRAVRAQFDALLSAAKCRSAEICMWCGATTPCLGTSDGKAGCSNNRWRA